ncbi:GEVED domain-containing protein [Novosphingobium sp.]|uniref:GEVED domain-containing protein n=1 Tax=Novosphingobium sp. TaxID=1874826 RepID=UPI0025FAFC3E|nr:GEVED domain-containing protein [Novosphingobium sp.]
MLTIICAVVVTSLLGAAPVSAQTTEICLGRVITTLDFSATPTLVSGTALQPGAVYRYSNVNFGIDALVRVVAFNNGASLATIDNNTAPIAGAPDLRAFFNPELGGADARSVDFQFTFVVAGTNTPLPFDFVATAIDVDGDSVSLREYAEFQNIYAEYLLNSPTNINVSAAGANTRFESATTFTAPGIDPTANQNIAATFYSQKSAFNYRIGALGTGATVRLTSLQFTCPNLPAPTGNPVSQDFGDAPSSYGNPRHDIIAGYRLGAAITGETGPYNSANASADSGDDGVTFSVIRPNNIATITVTVLGTAGRLQAWFDWNQDGDFLDPGEQVATNITDNGTGDTSATVGTIRLSVAVPASVALGQTFARFRWSSQSGLDATTLVGRDGEVEDYAVTVLGAPLLTTSKTSVVYTTTTFNGYSVPGNDVLYTITTSNLGSAATDSGSVFIVDSLPAQIDAFVGDFDGAGPATGTILFTQSNGAALTFTPSTDLKYSNLVAAPASFAACTYTPTVSGTYDTAIRHICLNPKQSLGFGSPSPTFTVQFRARIK